VYASTLQNYGPYLPKGAIFLAFGFLQEYQGQSMQQSLDDFNTRSSISFWEKLEACVAYLDHSEGTTDQRSCQFETFKDINQFTS
jgi:hypothetical protein